MPMHLLHAQNAKLTGKVFSSEDSKPLEDVNIYVKDLQNNVVKFIGDPVKRIEEDYLRIIRFIRFSIQYDHNTLESSTINAIKLNLIGIKKLSKERFQDLRKLVKSITSSQEDYAEKFGKDKSIQSDSIKRKERIKNIDVELENWRNLKSNSEKMTAELNERKDKIKFELNENKKNPERIATSKGQNLQNLENTKKRNEEIETELVESESKHLSLIHI